MSQRGICARCLELKQLEKHHLFPLEFFRKQRKAPIVMLCSECHRRLHKILPRKKLSKKQYVEITEQFLLGGHQRERWFEGGNYVVEVR